MTATPTPRVSIGLPVYNGERFLAAALDALLAQTFADFELIISDNASTDATESICRAYAARDRRIRYERLPANVGPAHNFSRLVGLARAPYYKWAAHDDLHHPDHVRSCVAALDHDPSVVLAHTRAISIGATGGLVKRAWGSIPGFSAGEPHVRFFAGLHPPPDPIPLPIFGVVRTAVLRRTRLMTAVPDSDRALVAELSLFGRFHETPEPLFMHREHGDRIGLKIVADRYAAPALWDTRLRRLSFPNWRLLRQHLAAVVSAPLRPAERLRCLAALAGWAREHAALLLRDLAVEGARLPLVGPAIASADRRRQADGWARDLRRATAEIAAVVPARSALVLVDDATFGVDQIDGRRALPFIESEGAYGGPPADNQAAIEELERMRSAGASHIVFGWPSFWWLDYYDELRDYLQARFRCVLKNSRVVVFDMRAPR